MKQNTTINIAQIQKILSLFIFLLIITNIAHAQPSDPGGGSDVDAPIDGGLSLLIAGGIGYGVKKVREKRKRNK